MRTALLIVLIAIGVGLCGMLYVDTVARGFSTRQQATWIEQAVARLARRWAVPARVRDARNPIPFSEEIWGDSRAHFADHCAACHANNGSGDTELGRSLYPKAPDMRRIDTQALTDGELYWIIENGVRLTGMPAWGTGRDDDADTWKLVHFIRHLSSLTEEQLKEMEALNPKTRSELQEEEDDRRFLSGDDSVSPPSPEHHH